MTEGPAPEHADLRCWTDATDRDAPRAGLGGGPQLVLDRRVQQPDRHRRRIDDTGGDHDHLDPDDHHDDIPDHDPDQHDDHDDHDDGARVAAYDPNGVQR